MNKMSTGTETSEEKMTIICEGKKGKSFESGAGVEG